MNISGTEIEVVTNPYGKSAAPIVNEYDDDIRSVLVKGPWHGDIIKFIRQNQIKGLYLNYAKGFECLNFDFLADLPELELLNIIYVPVDSLLSVESLINLKSLSLSCHWKNKIDLSQLKRLVRCSISYGKGAESIFKCSSLRYLYIDEFKIKNFSMIQNLEKLECLTIGNSNFNTPEVLECIHSLRKLVLLNCRKLDRLDGIGKLKNLEWLDIDGSKMLSSVEDLSALHNLKVLILSNNKEIETLSNIKDLNQLRALSFCGDTKIVDGDFGFLEKFPLLSLVNFVGRRHYTHKPARSWNWNEYESGKVGLIRK